MQPVGQGVHLNGNHPYDLLNLLPYILVIILSVVITLFLLMRYDWISEFSINHAGHLMPNWFAIFGMVFGFVILPLILFWLTRRERAENDERVK